MTVELWQLVVVICVAVGAVAWAGRYALHAWSLYQLKVLAHESYALQRWWDVLGQLPAEVLSQPLRCTLGRIMYQRLKRARRVQPDHHFLRDQQLQIARFIGRTPGDDGRRLTGAARQQAMAALGDLKRVLDESVSDGLISQAELERCEAGVAQSLTALEFAHYRQAALQAEYLQRIPQAIDHLRSALRAAQRLGSNGAEQREIERRLRHLEAGAGEPVALS
ncbi:MAG: hypothetical protein ACNA7W_15130 [Pseudomonadales bacterium]